MRVVFLGTPVFASRSLERLASAGHEILAAVTQPARPAGRGRHPRPSAVAARARELGLELMEPAKLGEAFERVRELAPELLVVVAYGRILPRAWLELAPRGAVNVHASLLPRWRGAAPVAYAILAGDSVSGVCTMRLDEGMDTGPIYLRREEPIAPEDTAESLSTRLADLGAGLLVETLAAMPGGLEPRPQAAGGATLAPRLTVADGRLDWADPARALERRVRAMIPWPGAHTTLRGRRLKILAARVVACGPGQPGEVVALTKEGFSVRCGEAALEVLRAQPEGRHIMPSIDIVNGRLLTSGERLGA